MLDSTLKLIVTFLLGMLTGAVLIVLIWLLLMLLSIKKRNYIIEAQNKDIEKVEILKLINECKENYKFAIKSDNKDIRQGAFKRNITCLAEDIASLFFPESKRPLAELTIDELIMVDKYIVQRIEEIVDRPGLRYFKKMKLNTLIDISQTKKKIDDSKAMQFVEKYKFKKVAKGALLALNAVNPVYWVKKLFDTVIKTAANKICLVIISISGQELYKVYSKKAFTEDEESLLDEDFGEVEKELKKLNKHKKETIVDVSEDIIDE